MGQVPQVVTNEPKATVVSDGTDDTRNALHPGGPSEALLALVGKGGSQAGT